MTRILTLVAVALVLAAPAAGANQTVTITKAGFVPSSVTVQVGEHVTFNNTDTTVHQIVFQKPSGITCTPANLVVQPGQSATCTFATAGSFSYTDAQQKNLKGTVVVQGPAASVSLSAAPSRVVYGGKVTLSGTVSSQAANERVTVKAQACGDSAAKTIATVTTTTGGAFTYLAQPLKNTAYSASAKSASSAAASVTVRPRVSLGKVAPRRYRVRVFAADSLAGKIVSFQRFNRVRGTWTTVKRVALAAGPAAVAPTVVSAATFTARVPTRARVRVVLPAAQAAPCYAAGTSNTITA